MGAILDEMDLRPEDLIDTGTTEETGIERLAEPGDEEQAPGTDDMTAPIPGGGLLLEEPNPKRVFKLVHDEVMSQERLAKNREEQDKHYDSVRRGVPFSFLEKSEDRSIIKRSLPPGITDTQQPVPNKLDDLATKIVSQVLVDAYLPNPKPDGDTDRNRGAADLTKKFLRQDGGPSGTDDAGLLRWALTTNVTRSAAFAYCWVDPTAGGWRPKQIKAHPQATDASNPLVGPKMDPVTNQPIPGTSETSTDPVLRYVAEVDMPPDHPVALQLMASGQPPIKQLVFTKNAAEAVRQWLPKHCRKDLLRSQVRTVPRSQSVARAHSVIVLMWESVREAKRRFPVLRSMKQDDIKTLCGWKPKRWKSIVPESQRPTGEDVENGSDNSLLFWYMIFCRIGDEYQDGGEVHVSGSQGGFILKRDTLREDVQLEDGTMMPVLLSMPIAEFVALQDMADQGDPQGRPPFAAFAGAGELYAQLYLAILEALDKGLNPNIYLASTSTVSRDDINRRDGTPIEILTSDDKPEYEKPPELPDFLPEILKGVELSMNSAAQTNETGNGLDSRYSTSGVAKEVALRTAKMLLSQYWQNTVTGLTQWWRIKTELAQARLTVPQQVRLSGEDSAYKQRWFVGSDLVGTSDIALAPGSGTMMSGSEKLQWLRMLQDAKWIDPEQAGELARASMADDLGLPPNVHEERINRQIADWVEGPPPDFDEKVAQNAQATTQYQSAIQGGVAELVNRGFDQTVAQAQVQQQVPQPQLAQLPEPFAPAPNDEQQDVAVIRAQKLSRLMSTVDYHRWGATWRKKVDDAYAIACAAAGMVTVRQQQQAAAAALQAQQTQALKLEQVKHAAQFKTTEAEAQLDAQARTLDAAEADKDRAVDLQKEQMRSDARAPRATPSAPPVQSEPRPA